MICHVAVYTTDLEKMKNFYEKYFNGQASKKYHNPKTHFESYFIYFDGNCALEIMTRPEIQDKAVGAKAGLDHLAFIVGDDNEVDEKAKLFLDDGFEVIGMPRRTGDGYYEAVILDPDGNKIELVAK